MSERATRWRHAFSSATHWVPARPRGHAEAGRGAYASNFRSVVGLLTVALVFAAFVGRATVLGMEKRPPVWVVDAVPAAVSDVLFHRETPYTSLAAVSDRFASLVQTDTPPADAASVNAAMASIASQLDPATVDRAYRLLGPDDKGIVDFVSLALRVFGLHVEGVFWLYVVVLGVSCGLFALAYLRRPAQLALLTCFLTMLFLIVPMLAFNRQVDSLLALRVFPVLSMVACLHALVFVARPSASRWQIGLLVAQVTLIILVEHIRSTAAWQIVALAAATLAVVVVRFRSWRASASQPRECWLRLGLASCPLVLVLAGHLALDRYRAWVFPAEYQRGEQTLARMVWHNVYSGFALQPELAQRYDLRIDDTSIIRATGQYLDETGRGTEWTEMGGTSPNFTAIRWAPYDQAVKDMLFARCTALARQCLTAFALDKPAALAGDLAWTYGLRELPPGVDVFTSLAAGDTVKTQVIEASERLDRTATRAHLWMPAVLALLLVLAASMTGASRPDCLAVAFAAAFLWAGSLVPSIVGYPAPHAVAEPAIATGMLIYLGLCGLAVGVIGRVRQMAGSSARPE